MMRCAMFGLIVGLMVGCSPSEQSAESKSTPDQNAEAAPAAAPAPKPEPVTVHPFNGKDLEGWTLSGYVKRSHWQVGTAKVDPSDPKKLIVEPGGSDLVSAGIVGANIHTDQKFGDARIELDVMIPAESNSGVFVMGEYEVQILDDPKANVDSPSDMDSGAIVTVSPPKKLIKLEPGQWHHYVIEYQAPRFDPTGAKMLDAQIRKVVINDQVVQAEVNVPNVTASNLTGEEHTEGPLMLQGAEGPVAFRNISITPLNR
ncbi:DUF1080 domain-containing protein [Planctomycetales bacterium ZRK34]|nr:DUF1080 domain-containing protein [Planctomycetales bacterium ZRK34]